MSEVYRDDNFYLVVRGGIYHLRAMVDGKRIRKSLKTTDIVKAKSMLENAKIQHESGWREDYDSADLTWKEVAERLVTRHREKAKYRGMPFSLTAGDAYRLMKSTGFRCAVSGIPFAKSIIKNGDRDPWSPSIDRLENRQGYYVENVRIVCLAANVAMNTWGYDALLRLSRAVVNSSKMVSEKSASHCRDDPETALKALIKLQNMS